MTSPHDLLRDRVSGAIARGEAAAITEQSTPEAREAYRKSVFAAFPYVGAFLGTLLEDAQLTEDEEAFSDGRAARDTGTIYDCPDSTFRVAVDECAAFVAKCDAAPLIQAGADDINLGAYIRESFRYVQEAIGSDLYLERRGHGAGFRDRATWSDDREEREAIGEALSAAVEPRGTLETYLGDDGQLYVVGKEEA